MAQAAGGPLVPAAGGGPRVGTIDDTITEGHAIAGAVGRDARLLLRGGLRPEPVRAALVPGAGEGIEHDEILEMLELFGDVVIPEFDRDPVHSTTRMREAARA